MVAFFVSPALCSEEELKSQEQGWLSDIRVGLLAHDVPIWSLSRKEGGVDLNTEFIFIWPNYSLSDGIVRSSLGISLNNQGDTSKIYSGFLWEYMWQSGLFLNLGIEIAVHDGETKKIIVIKRS